MLREHIMEAWLTRFQKGTRILIRNCNKGYLCDSLENMALIWPYLESMGEAKFKDNGLTSLAQELSRQENNSHLVLRKQL